MSRAGDTASATRFYKLTGSGNDFVFLVGAPTPGSAPGSAHGSAPGAPSESVELSREQIAAVCHRRTGVGADGVVVLEPLGSRDGARFRMHYWNADGSRAAMCGNAALCSTRLAVELGLAPGAGFTFASDVGLIPARLRDGIPEVDLGIVAGLLTDLPIAHVAGEHRIGFADTGVPHLVVACDDVAAVELDSRGAALRWMDDVGSSGANVNFVAAVGPNRFRMRTFERGVEGETLACGTGAVACAAVLAAWGLTGQRTTILTSSGLPVDVSLGGSSQRPSLRGEGRLVFAGELTAPF